VGSFEIWCWRGKKKLSLTDRVKNEEVSQRVKEDRNILHTIKRRKANWIGLILQRNYLLKNVTEERWNRRDEEEVDTIKQWITLKKREELEVERRSIRLHFLENRFGRGYGPVVGKTT
jgi:hypothetical protein